MKFLRYFLNLTVCMVLLSCSSLKPIQMAEDSWRISNHYGQAVNSDSTYCFSFGNTLVESEMPLIGRTELLSVQPKMYSYLQKVLKLARLEGSRVLFFAPTADALFVELLQGHISDKPNSISTRLADEKPYTGWIRDDDVEEWCRKSDEMYTNIYIDRKNKLLVVVDRFNYGDIPVARIQRIQTRTEKFSKDFPENEVSSVWADVTKPEHLEAISNWIDGHRAIAFENYRIGQELKQKLP